MITPENELLAKFGNSPGHCSASEILEVYNWLTEFNQQLTVYKIAFGEPAGASVHVLIDKAQWYKDNWNKQ